MRLYFMLILECNIKDIDLGFTWLLDLNPITLINHVALGKLFQKFALS